MYVCMRVCIYACVHVCIYAYSIPIGRFRHPAFLAALALLFFCLQAGAHNLAILRVLCADDGRVSEAISADLHAAQGGHDVQACGMRLVRCSFPTLLSWVEARTSLVWRACERERERGREGERAALTSSVQPLVSPFLSCACWTRCLVGFEKDEYDVFFVCVFLFLFSVGAGTLRALRKTTTTSPFPRITHL